MRRDDGLEDAVIDRLANKTAEFRVRIACAPPLFTRCGALFSITPILEHIKDASVLQLDITQIESERGGMAARSPRSCDTRPRSVGRDVSNLLDAERTQTRSPLNQGRDEPAIHHLVYGAPPVKLVDDAADGTFGPNVECRPLGAFCAIVCHAFALQERGAFIAAEPADIETRRGDLDARARP